MQGEVPISWGEATHRMNPAAHTGLETGKCRSTLELLQLWLQPSPPGWGPEPCLPPASKPARASEPGPAWPEHVHSLAGCWLRESGSSLCLKAVKINLFLKSSPQTALAPPHAGCSWGWGDLGSQSIPVGLSWSMRMLPKGVQPGCTPAAQESGSAARPAKQPPARCGCLVQEEATNDGTAPPEMLCSCSSWAWEGAECSFFPQVHC